MNKILFQDSSAGNTVAVVLFGVLILIMFIGLSMFSSGVRDKMGYERAKTDYKYHIVVFIIVGLAGVFSMGWKMSKVETVVQESETLILKGYFGNHIATLGPGEIASVRSILSPGRRSVEADVYTIEVQTRDKSYFTDYLSEGEAEGLKSKLDSFVIKKK